MKTSKTAPKTSKKTSTAAAEAILNGLATDGSLRGVEGTRMSLAVAASQGVLRLEDHLRVLCAIEAAERSLRNDAKARALRGAA